jgi:hypothetical protein
MKGAPLEGLAIALIFVSMFIVGHLLRLPKQKWHALDKRPLTKSYRMPYSFSLRALVIAIGLVAVVLGLLSWTARK